MVLRLNDGFEYTYNSTGKLTSILTATGQDYTILPDSSDTTSSGSDQLKLTYNVDASVAQQGNYKDRHCNERQLAMVAAPALHRDEISAWRQPELSWWIHL